jgi:hypothetical protein
MLTTAVAALLLLGKPIAGRCVFCFANVTEVCIRTLPGLGEGSDAAGGSGLLAQQHGYKPGKWLK